MKYHYTYRITNIVEHKHYYGTRSSKVKPENDLGVKYFSSSKDIDFIKDQKKNPRNYKYKIIKISKTRKEAIELEIKLHNKFNVGVNESFYNRCKQTSSGWDTTGKGDLGQANFGEKNGMFGKTHSDLSRKKIKEARRKQGSNVWNAGKKNIYNKDTLEKISQTVSNQRWVKKNNKHIKIHKDELEKYLNDGWVQGIIKNDLIICKYCEREMNIGNHNRWHGENCKFNPAPIDIA